MPAIMVSRRSAGRPRRVLAAGVLRRECPRLCRTKRREFDHLVQNLRNAAAIASRPRLSGMFSNPTSISSTVIEVIQTSNNGWIVDWLSGDEHIPANGGYQTAAD